MTQKERVYEFIKSQGRVFTHELNRWGDDNHINCTGTRARELKAELKIWRMNETLKKTLYPKIKEDIWSVLPEDREEPSEHESAMAENNLQQETAYNRRVLNTQLVLF